MRLRNFLSLLLALSSSPLCFSQLAPTLNWAARSRNAYHVEPNITYLTANNYEAKLDLYSRGDTDAPQPVVIYIHGGGWVGGTKEGSLPALLPWFAMGWDVVNVEYRLARVSLAPAAVEDCLCALKWVAANAQKYHFDTREIVVTGESAGGHLSLTTGMVPESAGLDRECPGTPLPKVAAIVDWYGITDVNDLLSGPNLKTYAVAWLGSMPDRKEIAERVSPLTYVRAGLPPTLMIQGDADPTVPYSHSVRLHEALDKAGVPNQLFTVSGGKHGHFTPEEQTRIFQTIQQFLAKYHLGQAHQ
jgi:acetyl esterase/lipase